MEIKVHSAMTMVRDDVLTVGLVELQDQERQFWERQQSYSKAMEPYLWLNCLPQSIQEQKYNQGERAGQGLAARRLWGKIRGRGREEKL